MMHWLYVHRSEFIALGVILILISFVEFLKAKIDARDQK